jgi:murein L,D-transpeptidase YcbB/YkuD
MAAEAVDWTEVSQGRQTVWLRQKPSPENMMGKVKFMFPNEFGIYLHDTPNKAAFTQNVRTLSAGCVRLQDAGRLGAWLFNGAVVGAHGDSAEQIVNLPVPTPVYILYLTASVDEAGKTTLLRDIYGRDPALRRVVLQQKPTSPARTSA